MKKEQQDKTFNRWLERHRGLLLKVVRSYAKALHDQDDLFQEIILQVWKSIPSFNESVAETTWIYRVSFYTSISWLRKTSKEKRVELGDSTSLLVQPNNPSDPKLDWLYEQIQALDPVDRSLTLLMLDGFSYREMAETLGMTESNVGVRINRIKKRLIQTSKVEPVHGS